MRFEHLGIVTHKRKPGARFVPATRAWVTDFMNHPFRIEWLRFEPDSPVTGPVRLMPHVAYRVDDVEEAGRGMQVLLAPFDASPRIVAFYQAADGAVVEFIQTKDA
jgi:hypothetical protein